MEKVEKSKTICYVQFADRTSAMPTCAAKARKLLKAKRAELVQLQPFTIRLKYQTATRVVQPITLAIETSSEVIGIAAVVAATGKVLYAAEADITAKTKWAKTKIAKLMLDRKGYRRARRGRVCYRSDRHSNRKRGKGYLMPTLRSIKQSHERLIKFVANKLLPVSTIKLRLHKYDTQKMQNPTIAGIEYQRGELWGYAIKGYVLDKSGHECVYCHNKKVPLMTSHDIPLSRGGSNRPANLWAACAKCITHKGEKTTAEFGYPKLSKQLNARYLRHTALNSGFKNQLQNWLIEQTSLAAKNREFTNPHILPVVAANSYGYETDYKLREVLGWRGKVRQAEKAIALALTIGQKTERPTTNYTVWFKNRSSRSLADAMPTSCHDFSKKAIRAMVYKKQDEQGIGEGQPDSELIEQALKLGVIRKLTASEIVQLANNPPTKLEALKFYQDMPGYRIVRHRKTNKKGVKLTNPTQDRRAIDGHAMRTKYRGWSKGAAVIGRDGQPCRVTGLDKGGQFYFKNIVTGETSRYNVLHIKRLVSHAVGVNQVLVSVA